MKSRLTRVGIIAVTLAVATTGLAGCGSADPSAAAIVDGVVIKDADLATVAKEVARLKGNERVTAGDVLGALIPATILRKHADEVKAPALSVDTVRSELEMPDREGKAIKPWDTVTLEALRDVNVLRQVGQGPARDRLVELVRGAKITVNPKYGDFDAQNMKLQQNLPNWMKIPEGAQVPPGQMPPGHPGQMPPGHPGQPGQVPPGHPGQPGQPGQEPPQAPPTPPATLPDSGTNPAPASPAPSGS